MMDLLIPMASNARPLFSSTTTNTLALAASSSRIISSWDMINLPSVAQKKKFIYAMAISNCAARPRDQEADHEYMHKSRPNRAAANSCPLTPLGFLERAARVYGDCPSVVYNNTTYTWSETHIRCVKLASAIVSLGINKGDVVSVVAPNIPAMYELHFAIPMANAILNTINLRLDAYTISVLLQHSESKLVFVDYQSSSLVHQAISQFPQNIRKPLLILITEDQEEEQESSPLAHETYDNMVRYGDSEFKWVQPESEWDPMTLNYTSGTTSAPKGVLHSQRARFLMAMDALLDWPLPKQSTYLWTLPMFHANGWSYTWATAAVGSTNVCLRGVNAPLIYEAINKHKVTHMCGAPTILNVLTNFPTIKQFELDHPVHILTAGAPPPAVVLLKVESLGFVVSHGYGLTETAGLVVTCAWKNEWDALPALERAKMKARQGVRTAGFTEVDVVEPQRGVSVERDGSTRGEIVFRGGSVMLSYFKDDEATSKCMKNGWFYSGDVGVMHTDGYLEVKDRSKDVIICGGENLSSVEVESILYAHPAVNEAAVVARPDEFWGETPCAFVSLKPEIDHNQKLPTEKDVREFCKSRLPLYMVPRTVVFMEELPKTSTGKIQKFLLRELAKDLSKRESNDL